MRIGRHSVNEMMRQVDMEDWLDHEGIDYRVSRGSSGIQLNIKECPVCGNSEWKVFLNAETGLGNCFAGSHPPGENYNKLKFIKSYLDTDFGSAVGYVSAYLTDLGWMPKREREHIQVNESAGEVLMPKSIAIPHDGQNLTYLEERGIPADVAKHFHLAYCYDGYFNYKDPVTGNDRHQSYAQRVMIPIYDLDGQFVTFQGRDITGNAFQKYLFPPGLAGSGRLLYNGYNAMGAEEIIINEGVFDVIATHMALREDPKMSHITPIGTFGKHLSFGDNGQLARILRLKEMGLKKITFMWDGSTDAFCASLNAASLLRSYDLELRIAKLPDDKDPNEVPSSVVRETYWRAFPFTVANEVKLKLKYRCPCVASDRVQY